MANRNLVPVTKENPCPHCGREKYCYSFIDSPLSVCSQNLIGEGWEQTTKTDKEGHYYLSPIKEKKERKEKALKSHHKHYYPDREGNKLIRQDIKRYEGLKSKDCPIYHWDGNEWKIGQKPVKNEQIPIYRYQEVRVAIERGELIFIVEGEGKADALWELGIPATCNIRGAGKFYNHHAKDLEGAAIVLCPDRDIPGLEHCEKMRLYFPDAQWLYARPDSFVWAYKNLPSKHGYDIHDWIREDKLTKEQILAAVQDYRENLKPDAIEIPDTPPPPNGGELNYTEKALQDLYGDCPHIAYGGNIYKWMGSHYQLLPQGRELQRVANWCLSQGSKYSTRQYVANIWEWILIRFGIDPEQLNPPGLNLKNGTLQFKWHQNGVKWELVPHNPKFLYDYCSEVEFNPNCDPSACDRFLQILEEGEREIFLKTIAASLDLDRVRAKRGRIKTLLLQGDGSNGKDSLRELVGLLFSQSMTGVSLADFRAYDGGDKFDIARLFGRTISWSSENTGNIVIDQIQSLKSAVTGDPIDCEYKRRDALSFKPKAVLIFNCNQPPIFVAGSEAIKSRFAILRFRKVFVAGPTVLEGQLLADPRFRYDAEFLLKLVAPAFLNRILEQLSLLLSEGIDYNPTNESLREIQEDSNPLWSFCREFGYQENASGSILLSDIWEDLTKWYQENSYLSVENGKNIWFLDKSDTYWIAKGPNKIYEKFKVLFPKLKKSRVTEHGENKNKITILGIAKTGLPGLPALPNQSEQGFQISHCLTQVRQLVSQLGSLQPLQEKAGKAGKPVSPLFAETKLELKNLIQEISELSQNLTHLLNTEDEMAKTLDISESQESNNFDPLEQIHWEFLDTPIPVFASESCENGLKMLLQKANKLVALTKPKQGKVVVFAENWFKEKVIEVNQIQPSQGNWLDAY